MKKSKIVSTSKTKKCKKHNNSYVYIAPAIAGIGLFTFFPIVYLIYLSLNKIDLLSGDQTFVGLSNYITLFKDAEFLQVLRNTTVFMVFQVIISISLALLLAVWLNKNKFISSLAQTAIFTPHIISLVSVSVLWLWIMEPNSGLLNYFLSFFGIGKIRWLESPNIALISIIIVSVWKTLGYNTLILLAGLKGIPETIYEAARLDNASKFRTFFKITIPLLSPSLFFLFITNVISSFQVFDSVKVMTQGGPLNSTNVLVHWIYQTGFEFYKIGEAATGSVVLLMIISIITLLNFKFLSKKVHYQ